MSVVSLTSNNFEKEVKQCEDIILVEFGANWCEQCKMLAPILNEISEEQEKIKIAMVDVEKEVKLANDNNIMSIPTMILFKNAQPIEILMGLKPKEEIINLIIKNR